MTTFQKILRLCAVLAGTSTLALSSAVAIAQDAEAPVTLLKTIPLPEIDQGGFDHFDVDLKNDRLFVTAEVHKTVEMFRLSDGTRLGSGSGFGFPHTSAYVPAQKQLFVADGDKGAVLVVDVPSLKIVQTIPLRPNPDEAVFDPESGLFYVGCGGAKEQSDNSSISIIDTAQHKEIGRIQVPSTNVESMAIDHARSLLYVNLRDRKQIAVIDLKTRSIKTIWDIPGLNMNTPLLLDAKTRRLFVVGRKPGTLFVVDADSGKLMSTLGVVETGDGATYDEANKRLYVTGTEGLSVLARVDADHFKEIQRLDTHLGKVSLYVPSTRQLYVVHPKTPTEPAALDIYAVKPAAAKRK